MTADNSDSVDWEEPPPVAGGHGQKGWWVTKLEPLMAQPKRWARLKEFPKPTIASSTAAHLRKNLRRIPPGRWEFVSRNVDGKGVIYGRYMGPDE